MDLPAPVKQLDPPLRGESFSVEHLSAHAGQMAGRHRISDQRWEDNRFIDRFESNRRFVAATYQTITSAVRNGEPIAPAAEWVIDNYHVVEEQLREIREDLPRRFYQELPKLDHGDWAGFPRVYELAHELVVHTDSSLDPDLIAGFVEAYQRTTPLTSGEVWAVPIMLRLVLIENLRRLCGHILATRECRQHAQEIVARWHAGDSAAGPPAAPESPLLVMQLIDCLRESNPEQRGMCLADVAQRFGQPHDAIDEMVRKEQQRLAADQVSIGNIVTSMRLLTGLDWKVFFERVSLVEQVLRQDPAHVYEHMDFASRDQYRHEVEGIAKRCRIDETRVASVAIDLALEAERREMDDVPRRHVGFFLVDEGRAELERLLHYRLRPGEWLSRLARRHANFVYLGGIGLGAIAGGFGVFTAAETLGGSRAVACLAGLLAVLPASELTIGLLNVLVTNLLRPRALPKVEFKDQIPAHCQTLVVIPTMLTSAGGIRSLLERLEIHYLANPESGLQFALLTDFADAPCEQSPEDDALLKQARAGIAALNARYCREERPRFHMLHRRRRWNAMEKTWMGWERKRGKLLELDRLLRGATDTTYLGGEAHLESLAGIKYVITLDADTRLPHGVAKRLIGAIAHPLNRAHFDPERGRVTQGYGILQPRVSVSLSSAGRSVFARVFANSPGLDPYCVAVSDVYQDLFGEGSYMGKGIYDVDAFAAAVDHSFPENRILSHDLIEGCYARVGLVTDIELFDEFPTRHDADARRLHRWARGDWQILPWLLPKVPTSGARRANPLTLLSKWKIFDNLRRTLVTPALIGFLLVGWLLFPPMAGLASWCALAVLATPLFAQTLSALVSWPRGIDWRRHARDLLEDLGRTLVQSGLTLIFVPYKALLMADAVVRTVFRLVISRRRLLEWETADAAEKRLKTNPWVSFREMGWVSVASLGLMFFLSPGARFAAIPILIGWIVSPAVSYWISRPIARAAEPLESADRRELRRIARKTWAFFETFVGADDHWLPPDNYQEYPKDKVAHRVSPTNEGVFVVSTLAAHDFGYLSLIDLAGLLEQNLESFERLDRFRGHVYNWYDTTTLEPLPPRYVSSADSGNLAACFITAHQGMHDILRAPLLSARLVEGILDSVAMVEDSLARLQPRGARFGGASLDALEGCLGNLRTAAASVPADVLAWWRLVERWQAVARQLTARLNAFETAVGVKTTELSKKVQLLASQLEGIHRQAEEFLPWLAVAAADCAAPHEGIAPTLPWAIAEPAWQTAWQALWSELSAPLSLEKLVTTRAWATPHIDVMRAAYDSAEQPAGRARFEAFAAALESGSHRAIEYNRRIEQLARKYLGLAMEMDFTLLYNPQRRLFSVGYNLEDARLDRAHYDILASESRMASLVAIAKGDVEHRHWFQLGRTLTETAGGKTLLSWGGTMFEYMMPTLFARDFKGSLLEQSCRTAVERQIAYGRECHVPWGISESAFSAQAANSDYHYQSFGVPGLGLKRGLSKDLVISPYSTALACEVDPAAAAANFRVLIGEGADGEWGLYDAIDYTPARVPEGERRVVVYCYMAHHHGMTMTALANCLLDHCMQRRFQAQPLIRSVELLLQERVPIAVLQFQPQAAEVPAIPLRPDAPAAVSRRLSTAATTVPRTHLLSNGKYAVMLTNAGGGYSACGTTALTRWRPDTTRDAWGQFFYLRNIESGRIWSAGFHPTRALADMYEVTYSIDKAEIHRYDGDLETYLEAAVSPENNSEVRQITIKNHGHKPVTIEITSYAELVLATQAADDAHPAFNKLFVETEYLAARRALLARRRPRDAGQKPLWAVHVLGLAPGAEEAVEFETDRARFLGRGRTPAAPAAMDPGARLSGSTGPVLDPIFSLRHQLHIAPDESASLAYTTAFAESRDEALNLADQYHDSRVVQRTFELAWADSQIEMSRMKVSPSNMQLYQRLASAVLFPDAAWRAPASVLKLNKRGQSSLWRFGISGDDPIVVVRVAEPEHRGHLRELLLAHEFWHSHGLKVDLVILNEHPAGYFDLFHEQLLELIQTTVHTTINKSGGVYLVRAAHISDEDRTLLLAAAAVSLSEERGSLAQQIELANEPAKRADPPVLRPTRKPSSRAEPRRRHSESASDLRFANRCGGFLPTGAYAIHLSAGQSTPAPWSNCIANPSFGFLVTESGGGYTWAGNSRENKLTAWSNDPVSDAPGEIVYVRDEETGEVWSPTPLPIRDGSDYSIEHARGYSRFIHSTREIRAELMLSISPRERVKFACLKLRNDSARARTLSATYYAEWVLGVSREKTQTHVWTSVDEVSGALVARNQYQEDSPDQVVFLHVLDRPHSATGDRTEFIGRNRDFARPAALERVRLSGATGAGLDPCGAVQTSLTLAPGQEAEVIFLLGQADRSDAMADLLARHRTPQEVHAAIDETISFWNTALETIQVETPNPALDLLVNHWLLYQTLSCRVWGRSAFYQSGGAYGFRDQLQDVMALVYSLPQVAREQILRAASRQFEMGDVQHWWHPPTGRGVRTRFADDYLWLAFVTSHYVATTGDAAILNERVSYLQAAPLEPGQDERYDRPDVSSLTEDLYAHCLRAIDYAFRFGAHGLPLMGSGDWNDGMNKVGAAGKGESVWMAWFLIVILRRFAPLVEARGDLERAAAFRSQAQTLLAAAEEHAWDGNWYRRAFFDDGTPLGSAQNDECRIDSIAQSWSVIAGADSERTQKAMQAVDEQLVRAEARLVLLLTPPFDKTPLDPGYIKGYLPGIRENGGQYTHAALWVVQALTLLGRGGRAVELFDMLNPVLLASAPDRVDTYRVEPFAVAADVYGQAPHLGRGGWTWYTGSASWMYRVAVESILGIELRGDKLRIAPCIPANWPGFDITLRRGQTRWRIAVKNPRGLERGLGQIKIDGEIQPNDQIVLVADHGEHLIEVEICPPVP